MKGGTEPASVTSGPQKGPSFSDECDGVKWFFIKGELSPLELNIIRNLNLIEARKDFFKKISIHRMWDEDFMLSLDQSGRALGFPEQISEVY